jgi:hypothetical protein
VFIGLNFSKSLTRKPHAEIVIGRHRHGVLLRDVERVADMIGMAVGQYDILDALDGGGLVRQAGLPVKKGSISTAWLPKSSRNAEWPNQVICMMSCLGRPSRKRTA